jgi:hypothetical protein
MAKRTCRVCGCTDDDCRQCIEKTGEPCHWVEEDLCSACADEMDGGPDDYDYVDIDDDDDEDFYIDDDEYDDDGDFDFSDDDDEEYPDET